MSQYRSAEKTAVIIGAGPAGLTAAFELLDKIGIKPIVLEQSSDIGGISKTVNYKGNRIDLGGHCFFSKSDRVMRFWLDLMPIQTAPAKDDILLGRQLPAADEYSKWRCNKRQYLANQRRRRISRGKFNCG